MIIIHVYVIYPGGKVHMLVVLIVDIHAGEVQEEFMHQTTSNIVHIMLCGKGAEYRIPKRVHYTL